MIVLLSLIAAGLTIILGVCLVLFARAPKRPDAPRGLREQGSMRLAWVMFLTPFVIGIGGCLTALWFLK